MANRSHSVLIVGGGSSGWMAAALMCKTLPHFDVTVIEASDIPIIGVGESTNVTVQYFHRLLGIDEKPFMRASNAAYKQAIRFANFNCQGGAFFHPFGSAVDMTRAAFSIGAQDQYPCRHLAQDGLFTPELAYSYQIDAGLYGQFLKEWCKERGVRHIVDKITIAKLDEHGSIASVETEKSGSLNADLYIDCSGFRSFLLGGALKVPFRSVDHQLLNDRAIAARIPYRDKAAELKSYTNCHALSAGWVWEIPLWSRWGTGYVYSSAFLSPSEAEAEYRAHLGEERARDLTFNHIQIRAGRHDVAWRNNCIAIGISYGFLEPLESTGLSLTQIAISHLLDELLNGALESNEATLKARERYNLREGEIFDSTRDFIMAHYVLTTREDSPYWKSIRHEVKRPDSLTNILNEARRGSYEAINAAANKFYKASNWNLILSGMNFFDGTRHAPSAIPLPEAQPHLKALETRIYSDDKELPPVDFKGIETGHPSWNPTW
jgi:tryptophan halogenase